MKRTFYFVLSIACLCAGSVQAQRRSDYSNKQQLAQRVKALASRYPQWVKASSLTKTLGGYDIWMLTIGEGASDQKPAMAVIGGVEGTHLLGVELAMGFSEQLLSATSQDSIQALLRQQTFYVFPNMSPDATEQYFAKLQYERSGNARTTDYDRDGQVAEDGFDDLDGNGRITWMRIADPSGTYIPNPIDLRSMIIADPAKGQQGQYIVLREGIDNDKDGLFNEDGSEGVAFNKNNTYNYQNFLPGAGEHAVSELENRALYDFLYDAFNVYAVVSFGPENNLANPQQGKEGAEVAPGRPGGRIIQSWSARDAAANAQVSALYNRFVQQGEAPKVTPGKGNFSDWAYYHYGRLSFSTPGWWIADQEKDPVAAYLHWADTQGIKDNYTPWKLIDHPDFPNKKVEVGGIHPFLLQNPPFELVDSLVSKHTDFLLHMTAFVPRIDLVDVKSEKLDGGLTRVSLKVLNTGIFPTHTQIGERSYFLKHIAVEVKPGATQSIVSGKPRQTTVPLGGRDFVELSWLVQGSGALTIEAGSPSSGKKSIHVAL